MLNSSKLSYLKLIFFFECENGNIWFVPCCSVSFSWTFLLNLLPATNPPLCVRLNVLAAGKLQFPFLKLQQKEEKSLWF